MDVYGADDMQKRVQVYLWNTWAFQKYTEEKREGTWFIIVKVLFQKQGLYEKGTKIGEGKDDNLSR